MTSSIDFSTVPIQFNSPSLSSRINSHTPHLFPLSVFHTQRTHRITILSIRLFIPLRAPSLHYTYALHLSIKSPSIQQKLLRYRYKSSTIDPKERRHRVQLVCVSGTKRNEIVCVEREREKGRSGRAHGCVCAPFYREGCGVSDERERE